VNVDAKLEPIRRDSTPERIAARLREGIIVGTLSPGEPLREVDIARQLQVSRGPVREAFQRLIQEGLLESQPARGVFVLKLDASDVADVYLSRRALETAAARLIAEGGHRDAVGALEAALAALAATPESDWAELSRLDLEWHETLIRGANSKRLSRMFHTLVAETRLCMLALEPFYPDRQEMVAEHREITEAIADGNSAAAISLLDRHMDDSIERLTTRFASNHSPA
jgi:DNA-binding GntR family transcriptional regulator